MRGGATPDYCDWLSEKYLGSLHELEASQRQPERPVGHAALYQDPHHDPIRPKVTLAMLSPRIPRGPFIKLVLFDD